MNILKKKKEADEEQRLQEALAEFQETFEDGTSRHVPKTFIRSDIVNADKQISLMPIIYKPSPIIQNKVSFPASSANLEHARKIAEEAAKKIMQQASSRSKNVPVNRPPKPETKKPNHPTKMSNLEIFKEELKQVQAMRQERKGNLHQQGVSNDHNSSLDLISTGGEYDDDPTTTNLYVSNLPLDLQMEDLYETFGSFGPLASAKILYPRPDDDRRRDYLCGFIAFMCRTDAARACYAMTGERMKDTELRISWARPVTIPNTPFYVPTPLWELAMPDPPSGLPFNAKPLSSELRSFLQKYQNLPRLNTPLLNNENLIEDYKKMISNSIVRVVIPTERPLLALIHRVIEFIVREGSMFEAMLMAREHSNPLYRFLFENHHPTHIYYRWKLYSVLQGEDRKKWRLDRFKMFTSGSWWEPPPHSLFDNGMPPQLYNTAYVSKKRSSHRVTDETLRKRFCSSSSDGDGDGDGDCHRRQSPSHTDTRQVEKSKKYRGVLNKCERGELDNILRNILPEKTSVGDAMMWCVEHADCAKEIVKSIYDSLSIRQSPLHKKIARIYLCSDILANCGARLRDVFYFRQYFGDYLTKIFLSLNESLESIQSRIKAEQFRQRVMLCFRIWEDNAIYPTEILINLQNIFLGLLKPSDSDVNNFDNLDGEPISLSDNDIDGVPLDIDGIPLDDGGVVSFSVTASMYDNKELSSKPIKYSLRKESSQALFTTSSWSQVNPSAECFSSKWDNIEDLTSGIHDGNRFKDVNDSRNQAANAHRSPNGVDDSGNKLKAQIESLSGNYNLKEYDEERRKMLRDIEVKIVKLQDELESDRQGKNIDEELSNYRKKLTDKMEEKLAKLVSKKLKKEKSPKVNRKHNESSIRDHLTDNENNSREKDRIRRKDRSRSRDRSRERERHRHNEDSLRDKDRQRDKDKDRNRNDKRRERSLERRRR